MTIAGGARQSGAWLTTTCQASFDLPPFSTVFVKRSRSILVLGHGGRRRSCAHTRNARAAAIKRVPKVSAGREKESASGQEQTRRVGLTATESSAPHSTISPGSYDSRHTTSSRQLTLLQALLVCLPEGLTCDFDKFSAAAPILRISTRTIGSFMKLSYRALKYSEPDHLLLNSWI
jgi:hypothetical protein